MKRYFKLIIFMFISFFFINKNVFAECSYDVRKSLLEDAKKVNISYAIKQKKVTETMQNPNTDKIEDIEHEVDYFEFNISDVSENVFIYIINDLNDEEDFVSKELLKDGIYSFENDDLINIMSYSFIIKSNNNECLGKELITKEIVKPKQNELYFYRMCSDQKLVNNKYCQKYINKDFSKSYEDILLELSKIVNPEKIKNENISSKQTISNFINKNIYYFIIAGFLLIIIVIFIIIKKRRERL